MKKLAIKVNETISLRTLQGEEDGTGFERALVFVVVAALGVRGGWARAIIAGFAFEIEY
mgnify:CR=1 FL=1|jgi:hypothetical protein